MKIKTINTGEWWEQPKTRLFKFYMKEPEKQLDTKEWADYITKSGYTHPVDQGVLHIDPDKVPEGQKYAHTIEFI